MKKPTIEWVDIPEGIFEMGSPKDEKLRITTSISKFKGGDETQHMVTLSAFKMSKYAITFEQYKPFCDEMGFQLPWDAGWGMGKRPMIYVSWDDANNFALWMDCRLPTEAEWEYACRAGTNTPYNTGNTLTKTQANIEGDKTMPVGSFKPNAWGLHEMHGNVVEWCSDWYGDYPSGPQTNPSGPSSGKERVTRGGGWGSSADLCRSAFRNKVEPEEYGYDAIGFRLVCPL